MTQIEPVVEATVNKALNKVIAKKASQAVNNYLDHPTKSIEDEINLKENGGYDDSFTDDDAGDTNTPARLGSSRGLDTYNDEDKKKLATERQQVKEHSEFDIFVDYGNVSADGDDGFSMKYAIEMAGSSVGNEIHPFSWEEVQRKYASQLGTGKYTVKAKNPFTGRIIKTQTKHILKPLVSAEGQNMQTVAATETVTKTQQVMMEQFDNQRRFDLEREDRTKADLKERNDRLEKALEESRREKEKDNALMFDKIAALMQPKQQDLSWLKELAPLVLPLLVPKKTDNNNDKMIEMMFKIQEGTNKQMEGLQKNMEKSNDRMMEMIKEIATKSAAPAKTDTLADSMKMFAVLKGIEDSGFEKFKMMNELARERADELADEKENAGSTKSDSLLDKLLLTAAPLITGAMMGAGKTPNLPAPTPMRNPQPQVLPRQVSAQPRGDLPSEASLGGNTATRPRVHQSENRTIRTAPTQAQTHAPEAHSTGSSRGTFVRPGSTKGVSGVNDIVNEFRNTPKAVIAPVPATFEERKVNVANSSPVVPTAEERQQNIEKVMSVITPVALQRVLDDHATVPATATECINALIHEGVNLSLVSRDFDEMTLSNILVMVPEEYHANLKDLRNEILRQIESNYGVNG